MTVTGMWTKSVPVKSVIPEAVVSIGVNANPVLRNVLVHPAFPIVHEEPGRPPVQAQHSPAVKYVMEKTTTAMDVSMSF